jgi:hypothetical protein
MFLSVKPLIEPDDDCDEDTVDLAMTRDLPSYLIDSSLSLQTNSISGWLLWSS